MLQMIQLNHRTLRGISPVEIPHYSFMSTYGQLMTSISSPCLMHCPFVTQFHWSAPLLVHDHNVDVSSRLVQFQQLKDILSKQHNNGLLRLETITLHEYSNWKWTSEELSCFLQPQSNGNMVFPSRYVYIVSSKQLLFQCLVLTLI
jgi:hypothetical protein